MTIHEPAVLVGLSYVIGFVTAFIAFALPHEKVNAPALALDAPELSTEVETTATAVRAASLQVATDELGLYALYNGKKQYISAKQTDSALTGAGFHARTPTFAISPTHDFVLYCEHQSPDSETCSQYVYDPAAHIVHPVVSHDGIVQKDISAPKLDWREDGTLLYDGHGSLSADRPWVLD